MAVKPIKEMPKPEINERMELLKKDVHEIIEKRIPVSEIIDPPYPQSTMRERLGKAIRIVVWGCATMWGRKHTPRINDVFTIESRKKDGIVHWYVRFDIEKWDAEWAKIKAEDNV